MLVKIQLIIDTIFNCRNRNEFIELIYNEMDVYIKKYGKSYRSKK